MTDHRRLEVWKRSKEVARRVYFVVRGLPRDDQRRLGDQMIRAANSVPNNLAEGANVGSDAKYLDHVYHSIGSANELHDQLTGLQDIHLLSARDQDLPGEALEIGAMLGGLAASLERKLGMPPRKKARRKPRRPFH